LLSCGTPLQEINLSFGEITEAAALVVAQAVTDKPHMEKMDLNGTLTHCRNCFFFIVKMVKVLLES